MDRAEQAQWIRHRPKAHTCGERGVTASPPQARPGMTERIAVAYRKALETPIGDPGSFWLTIMPEVKAPCHEALIDPAPGRRLTMLADPGQSTLHYGFDELYDHTGREADGLHHLSTSPDWLYDTLRRLGEAVGAVRLTYPEAYHLHSEGMIGVEDLLQALDRTFGFKVTFPNAFPGEIGLQTSRGVASFRAIQALYQAWRLFELARRRPSARIVEIGGGRGWTAYFARQFGLKHYLMIDIPLSCVAQANFLSRCLGPEHVSLFGEPSFPGQIRIAPPSALFDGDEIFDLAANFDSFTEMAKPTALRYLTALRERASIILSVNHEVNPFTVRHLLNELAITPLSRQPYWLRRGYVEELIAGR
jgi:hypothetical protein